MLFSLQLGTIRKSLKGKPGGVLAYFEKLLFLNTRKASFVFKNESFLEDHKAKKSIEITKIFLQN